MRRGVNDSESRYRGVNNCKEVISMQKSRLRISILTISRYYFIVAHIRSNDLKLFGWLIPNRARYVAMDKCIERRNR